MEDKNEPIQTGKKSNSFFIPLLSFHYFLDFFTVTFLLWELERLFSR